MFFFKMILLSNAVKNKNSQTDALLNLTLSALPPALSQFLGAVVAISNFKLPNYDAAYELVVDTGLMILRRKQISKTDSSCYCMSDASAQPAGHFQITRTMIIENSKLDDVAEAMDALYCSANRWDQKCHGSAEQEFE